MRLNERRHTFAETGTSSSGIQELVQEDLGKANVAADHVKLVELHAEQQEAQDLVDALYARWEELEAKAA